MATPSDPRWWRRQALVGGVVAGLAFAVFEMVMAAMRMGPPRTFIMPLRMMAAMILGPAALEPSYSAVVAAVTGGLIHLVLSVTFAVIFVHLVRIAFGHWGSDVLILAATAYGVLLWLMNFYVVARIAGWEWFPERTEPIVQFFAHAFFFGTVLGSYLDRAGTGRARRPEERLRRHAA
jgi:hypothetical protein